jgi:hypothetical protein
MGGVMLLIYWVLYQTQRWYGTADGYFPVNFSEDNHDWMNPDTEEIMVDMSSS